MTTVSSKCFPGVQCITRLPALQDRIDCEKPRYNPCHTSVSQSRLERTNQPKDPNGHANARTVRSGTVRRMNVTMLQSHVRRSEKPSQKFPASSRSAGQRRATPPLLAQAAAVHIVILGSDRRMGSTDGNKRRQRFQDTQRGGSRLASLVPVFEGAAGAE